MGTVGRGGEGAGPAGGVAGRRPADGVARRALEKDKDDGRCYKQCWGVTSYK